MSEMSTRDVIAGALEILADKENWAKGTESRMELETDGWAVHEQSCLWGAFKRAVIPGYYQLGHSVEELRQVGDLIIPAAELVGKVICEQYPDRMDGDGFDRELDKKYDSVIPFNDHPETVHSEVIAVLEKALANL